MADYTTEQMTMWRHIITRIWICYVVPNALVAMACGFVIGIATARLLGWQP